MRLLHVTDLHAHDGQLLWLVRESSKFELVCITGDLLDLNSSRSVVDQLKRVSTALRQIKTPIAICSGNHDSVAGDSLQLEHARWMQDLRRENVWVDGDRFTFLGASFRCLPWLGQLESASPDEIWLIHAPPDESPTGITRGGSGFGDLEFGSLCRAGRGPRLALSGHVHDPEWWHAHIGRTWSLNPGCAEGKNVPNHIVLDLERGVGFLQRSSGDIDAVRLWAPPIRLRS